MKRAVNLLRQAPHYRRECFDAGLMASGFKVVDLIRHPEPSDALLSWNRKTGGAEQADHFERCGAAVLVAENCMFGNDWRGGNWYSLARRHVAMTGGTWPDAGPERWDSWGVELVPWKTGGTETVIFEQRQIGHPDVRSPDRWAQKVQRKYGGRIRAHPGTGPVVPLVDDLANASCVITWSSAAAIQALALGVPVWHEHPRFAGAIAAQPLALYGAEPKREDADRLKCFRRLAGAIWTLDEIRSGEAFASVLGT